MASILTSDIKKCSDTLKHIPRVLLTDIYSTFFKPALRQPVKYLAYHLCAGICPACKRDHHQDGCKQSGHGHGSQLSTLPIWRPQSDLWEHPQGDVLHPGADPAVGHQLHGWNPIAPTLHLSPPYLAYSFHRPPIKPCSFQTLDITTAPEHTWPLQFVYFSGKTKTTMFWVCPRWVIQLIQLLYICVDDLFNWSSLEENGSFHMITLQAKNRAQAVLGRVFIYT